MEARRKRPTTGSDYVELKMTPAEAAALLRYLGGLGDGAAITAAIDAVAALER